MRTIPGTVFSTAGLVGGYAAARATRRRALGGAVLAACGAAAFESWRRTAGPRTAAALTGVYVAAFGASHPLATRLGAWPAVLSVTGATAVAGAVAGDRCCRAAAHGRP